MEAGKNESAMAPTPGVNAEWVEIGVERTRIGRAGPVSLVVYDITGRVVRTLGTRELAQGLHSAVWDGLDESGRAVSSGVYCSKLEFDGRSQTGKLVLLK